MELAIYTYNIGQTQQLKKKMLMKKCSPNEKVILLILSILMQTKLSCYPLILSLLNRMPVVFIMIIYLCPELGKTQIISQ